MKSGLELKDVIGYIATAFTIGLFLTGISICQTIWQNKSTLGTSPLPFFTCFVSCSLWICYGFGAHDTVLIIVNLVGLILQIFYLAFYYYMSNNKRDMQKKFVILALTILSLLLFANFFKDNREKMVSIIGFMSSVASIVFMGSPLSNIVLVIRTKSTESMPLPLILASFVMSSLWVYYGILVDDYVVQIPNLIGSFITAVQLLLFMVYPGERNLPTQHL